MRLFILGLFAILALFTIVAWITIPQKVEGNKTPIVWTTDPNPQRDPQVEWFNKLNEDCHLLIDPANSDVMKVTVQSSANMGPDIIGHVNAYSFQIYYDAGILLDVTEKAKEMGFGPETLPETVRPFVMKKVLTKDGKLEDRQFVYPCNVFHSYLLYNKNIFDKYGIEYPPEDMTWERYIKIAKELTLFTGKNKKIPLIFGGADVDPYILIWEKGGSVINKDGTKCTLDSKEAIEAMCFYHDLLFKYAVEPTPTQRTGVSSQGGWGGGYMNWFGEGKIAMYKGARWMLVQFRRFIMEQREMKSRWLKAHPDAKKYEGPEVLRLGATLMPRFKDGQRYTLYGARCAGINKKGKNIEESLRFLKYLASEEYSKTINDGADSKPGNEKYVNIELFRHKDYPEEEEVHDMSIKSIPFGRSLNTSPFVANAVVMRIFNQMKDKMITDSNAEMTHEQIASLMRTTAAKINFEIKRNIERSPYMQKIYQILLKQGAEPIAGEDTK